FADRYRFTDSDPGFEVVEVISPHRDLAAHVPQMVVQRGPLGPLGSLVEQMQHALPEHVTVT
ncbi:MAG: hypothetical protein ABI200_01140, partial [Gaiellales bacterium]